MADRRGIRGLCLILDQDTLSIPPENAMQEALAGGARFFQYRSKGGTRREIYRTSLALAARARTAGALFIVNDHADIAAAVGADGVHLGQDDLPLAAARRVVGDGALIGISTHSLEQAIEAEQAGASYIGFGPIFETATKDAGALQGPASITAIRQRIGIPIIAIGGITRDNAAEIVRAGAAGAAVISAILRSEHIRSATADMISILERSGRTS